VSGALSQFLTATAEYKAYQVDVSVSISVKFSVYQSVVVATSMYQFDSIVLTSWIGVFVVLSVSIPNCFQYSVGYLFV
jgi:hypothetical protein